MPSRRPPFSSFALAALSLGLPSCSTAGRAPPGGPYALVLGTAQDGGLPQIGCEDEPCREARADPSRRRLVASLLLVDPEAGKRWLIDATPDLREQVERMRGHPPSRAQGGPRPALVDGILLTHAHAGHYAGLLQLGREVYAARGTPLYGSRRVREFLASNGPWDLLVRAGHVALLELAPGTPLPLSSALRVTATGVPHRDEYTDTLALFVEGPRRSLLYLPDIDKWERWDERIEDWIARAHVALVDGTFYAEGEVPGRSLAEVPHPFIRESLARFAALPAAERAKIVFTHLNHTNPAADERSHAAAAIRAAGMAVAREGQVIEL